MPDAKTGEAVKLFVVKLANASLTEADVIAHCRAAMTSYKVPRIVRFVEAPSSFPSEAILPPRIPISPEYHGDPVPSTMWPFRMTRS